MLGQPTTLVFPWLLFILDIEIAPYVRFESADLFEHCLEQQSPILDWHLITLGGRVIKHLLARRQHLFPVALTFWISLSNDDFPQIYCPELQVRHQLRTSEPLVLCTSSVPNFGPKPDFQPFSPEQHQSGCWLPKGTVSCFLVVPLTAAVIHPRTFCLKGMPMSAADGHLPCSWLLPMELATADSQRNDSHWEPSHLPRPEACLISASSPEQCHTGQIQPSLLRALKKVICPADAEVPSTTKGPAPEERLYGNRRDGKGKQQHPCQQHMLHGR